MVIRTSFRGMVIWFLVSGVLGLAGLSSVETDKACGEWGYVIKNSTQCVQSDGVALAQFGGLSCLLAALSLGWGFFKAYRSSKSSMW